MSEMNLPPFYVGQKVVQLVDGINSKTKKGDVHIVLGIKRFKCGCWTINIGQSAKTPSTYCDKCKSYGNINNGIRWVGAEYFAPVQENFQSISLEKVLEQETKLISVN